jgi:subtilisin family serine protease
MKYRKIVYLATTLLFISPVLQAQVSFSHRASHQLVKQPIPPNCSVEAATLRMDLERGTPLSTLQSKYPVSHHGGEHVVPALIKVTDDFNPSALAAHRVQINTHLGTLYSIHIPVSSYQEFIGIEGITYIELSKKVFSRLDKALEASGVNRIHRGEDLSQPFSGKDVVMGIIDFGFDYTHPTFYDPETGVYRIVKVWEQNASTGSPPEGFSYGRELTDEQALLNARTDIELTGHGTHVAGIAAGSGGALQAQYRGVAYDSEIVLVSLNAGDGISGKNTGVIDGINYIFQYAESVGKAAVVTLSQGHHTGPHDGTSLADQAIDALSGPGRIIVGAVGNEGDPTGFYLHFDHLFDEENNILSYLVWPDGISAGSTIVDIWGEAGKDFQVGIELFNPKTKTREAVGEILLSQSPVSLISGALVDEEGDTLYYEGGIEISPLNNRPHAQIYIDNTGQSRGDDVNYDDLLDNDFVQLRFQAATGKVHAWAANNSGEAFFTDLSGIGADEFIEGSRVLGGNPNSTMGELGGTARSIISVGGFTTKNAFTNTNGDRVSVAETIGDAYIRSSRGPTLDGRIKPDISAPANLIASAENSFFTDFDPLTEVAIIENGGGTPWGFSIRRGTSAAAPLVAGVAALMLEADAELSPDGIKELLFAHGKADQFTGPLPNQLWGYGKVDAYGAIASMTRITSVGPDPHAGATTVFPNPNRGRFSLDSDLRGPVQITVLDYTGRSVFTGDYLKSGNILNIQLPEHLNGMYLLNLKHNEGAFQAKLVVLN